MTRSSSSESSQRDLQEMPVNSIERKNPNLSKETKCSLLSSKKGVAVFKEKSDGDDRASRDNSSRSKSLPIKTKNYFTKQTNNIDYFKSSPANNGKPDGRPSISNYHNDIRPGDKLINLGMDGLSKMDGSRLGRLDSDNSEMHHNSQRNRPISLQEESKEENIEINMNEPGGKGYINEAVTIQRIFRGHKVRMNRKFKNFHGVLKELQIILELSGKQSIYSDTAITSFIASEHLNLNLHQSSSHLLTEGINKSFEKHNESLRLNIDNYEQLDYPDDYLLYLIHTIKERVNKILPNEHKKYGDIFFNQIETNKDCFNLFAGLIMGGRANCQLHALILRAFLINKLPGNILNDIGSNNIQVCKYEFIDHGFVVIKNFYGEEDIPDNHLVMDTWLQHAYLPVLKSYRNKPALPTSFKHYLKFISQTDETEIIKYFKNKISEAASDKDITTCKGYMGPLEGYIKFLANHPDGVYIKTKETNYILVGEPTIPHDFINKPEYLKDMTSFFNKDQHINDTFYNIIFLFCVVVNELDNDDNQI